MAAFELWQPFRLHLFLRIWISSTPNRGHNHSFNFCRNGWGNGRDTVTGIVVWPSADLQTRNPMVVGPDAAGATGGADRGEYRGKPAGDVTEFVAGRLDG